MTSPALLITRDDLLLEDLLRLAAAAGTTLDVAHDTTAALRGWGAASVVPAVDGGRPAQPVHEIGPDKGRPPVRGAEPGAAGSRLLGGRAGTEPDGLGGVPPAIGGYVR